jgi:hypothetical protein
MTYQQRFEQLKQDFTEKSERYLQAEKQFSSILGWGDSDELMQFLNAKSAFEAADDEYHEFLLHVREKGILPDEPFVQS